MSNESKFGLTGGSSVNAALAPGQETGDKMILVPSAEVHGAGMRGFGPIIHADSFGYAAQESEGDPTANPSARVCTDDPAVLEAFRDVHSHYRVWRELLVEKIEAYRAVHDVDNRTYWEHELRAFDRTFNAIQTLPLPERTTRR